MFPLLQVRADTESTADNAADCDDFLPFITYTSIRAVVLITPTAKKLCYLNHLDVNQISDAVVYWSMTAQGNLSL